MRRWAACGLLRLPSCIRVVPFEVKEVDVQEEAFEVEQARQHEAKGPLRGVDVNEDKCSLPSRGWRMLAPAWCGSPQVRRLGAHRRRLEVQPRVQAVLAEWCRGHRGSGGRKGGERI